MPDPHLFTNLVILWALVGLAFVPLQLKITAPYGRHVRPGWGPGIPNRPAWIIMESVSLLVFAGLFLAGGNSKTAPMWIAFALWTAHYAHRSFVFPLRMRSSHKQMPLTIMGSAILFNAVNAGVNGAWLGWIGEPYPPAWLTDPRFIAGLILFGCGAAINLWADNRLIALRTTDTAHYSVPRGGLFRYISCPNHFGEIVEWTGFALLCWNLPALSFAVWTAANLIPRAISHHRWYRRQFADYPRDRKAVIPWLL